MSQIGGRPEPPPLMGAHRLPVKQAESLQKPQDLRSKAEENAYNTLANNMGKSPEHVKRLAQTSPLVRQQLNQLTKKELTKLEKQARVANIGQSQISKLPQLPQLPQNQQLISKHRITQSEAGPKKVVRDTQQAAKGLRGNSGTEKAPEGMALEASEGVMMLKARVSQTMTDIVQKETGAVSAKEEERKNTLNHVRQEMLNTEISYNESLDSLINELKANEEVKGAFENDIKCLEKLKEASDQIVQEVRVCLDTKDDQRLAALFSGVEKESPVMKFFESARTYVPEHKSFAERLRKFKSDSNMQGWAITPVQRGPRYMLLLEEVRKNADEKDGKNLKEAVDNVKQQTGFVNEVVRRRETLLGLKEEVNAALNGMKENKKVIVDDGKIKVKKSKFPKKHKLNPAAISLMFEHIREIQRDGIDCSAEIKQLQDNPSFQKLMDKDDDLKKQFQGLS